MNANQLNDYVASQIKLDADRKVMPLVHAIKEELAGQARNTEKLAALTAQVSKDNAESDKRITALQQDLGKAQQEVAALAEKLTSTTAAAVQE